MRFPGGEGSFEYRSICVSEERLICPSGCGFDKLKRRAVLGYGLSIPFRAIHSGFSGTLGLHA
jgi:hypothetical protein